MAVLYKFYEILGKIFTMRKSREHWHLYFCRKFYELATHRDRRAVDVTSPWKRPRRPGVNNKCPSWWESVRLQLPYRPQCPVELGLYHTVTVLLSTASQRYNLRHRAHTRLLPEHSPSLLSYTHAIQEHILGFSSIIHEYSFIHYYIHVVI